MGEKKINNKRPMGHIAHLRNQFKSMDTFEQSYDDNNEDRQLTNFDQKSSLEPSAQVS